MDAHTRGRPMVPLTVSGQGGWVIGAAPHPGWLELVIVDFRGRALAHDATQSGRTIARRPVKIPPQSWPMR